MSREDIKNLVIDTISSFGVENNIQIDLSNIEDTRLFGGNSVIDSMALVSLIVEIEEAIETKIGKSIILADEKAMSRRTSPFSKVGYLVDYILELVN